MGNSLENRQGSWYDEKDDHDEFKEDAEWIHKDKKSFYLSFYKGFKRARKKRLKKF